MLMLTTVPLNSVIIQEEPADDYRYHSPRPSSTHNNFRRREACFPLSESLTVSISDLLRDGYLAIALGFRVFEQAEQ
jgi:hypothetical protein